MIREVRPRINARADVIELEAEVEAVAVEIGRVGETERGQRDLADVVGTSETLQVRLEAVHDLQRKRPTPTRGSERKDRAHLFHAKGNN